MTSPHNSLAANAANAYIPCNGHSDLHVGKKLRLRASSASVPQKYVTTFSAFVILVICLEQWVFRYSSRASFHPREGCIKLDGNSLELAKVKE
eukprot:8526855-Pyramimonas_sp.AAC.2